ncbi:MAG: PilZ domain-containing protein [Acidobacteriota bacterium]|nr:PilZ domain-containing protein [Acidobacteriota bacterium]
MKNDRRAGSERRTDERVPADVEIEWEGMIGKKIGVIRDITTHGCFILCSGEVEDGETVKVYFPLNDGRQIQFWGEVSNHVFEIGFALKFIELTDPQTEFLEFFVDTLREK